MTKRTVSVGIAAEDLVIGDYVSVISPKKRPHRRLVMGHDEDGDPNFRVVVDRSNENDVAGVPHKLLGISWPWAVFGVLVPGGEIDGPVIHDLRKIKCLRLGEDYVNAIKAFEKPVQDRPLPDVPF